MAGLLRRRPATPRRFPVGGTTMMLALEREPRQRRRWGQLVARAWDDDGFRQRLLTEPEAVLREEGIDGPAGIVVRVVEGDEAADSRQVAYLRLPSKPADDDLVEDDLSLPQHFSNGAGLCCHKTFSGCGGLCRR